MDILLVVYLFLLGLLVFLSIRNLIRFLKKRK